MSVTVSLSKVRSYFITVISIEVNEGILKSNAFLHSLSLSFLSVHSIHHFNPSAARGSRVVSSLTVIFEADVPYGDSPVCANVVSN